MEEGSWAPPPLSVSPPASSIASSERGAVDDVPSSVGSALAGGSTWIDSSSAFDAAAIGASFTEAVPGATAGLGPDILLPQPVLPPSTLTRWERTSPTTSWDAASGLNRAAGGGTHATTASSSLGQTLRGRPRSRENPLAATSDQGAASVPYDGGTAVSSCGDSGLEAHEVTKDPATDASAAAKVDRLLVPVEVAEAPARRSRGSLAAAALAVAAAAAPGGAAEQASVCRLGSIVGGAATASSDDSSSQADGEQSGLRSLLRESSRQIFQEDPVYGGVVPPKMPPPRSPPPRSRPAAPRPSSAGRAAAERASSSRLRLEHRLADLEHQLHVLSSENAELRRQQHRQQVVAAVTAPAGLRAAASTTPASGVMSAGPSESLSPPVNGKVAGGPPSPCAPLPCATASAGSGCTGTPIGNGTASGRVGGADAGAGSCQQATEVSLAMAAETHEPPNASRPAAMADTGALNADLLERFMREFKRRRRRLHAAYYTATLASGPTDGVGTSCSSTAVARGDDADPAADLTRCYDEWQKHRAVLDTGEHAVGQALWALRRKGKSDLAVEGAALWRRLGECLSGAIVAAQCPPAEGPPEGALEGGVGYSLVDGGALQTSETVSRMPAEIAHLMQRLAAQARPAPDSRTAFVGAASSSPLPNSAPTLTVPSLSVAAMGSEGANSGGRPFGSASPPPPGHVRRSISTPYMSSLPPVSAQHQLATPSNHMFAEQVVAATLYSGPSSAAIPVESVTAPATPEKAWTAVSAFPPRTWTPSQTENVGHASGAAAAGAAFERGLTVGNITVSHLPEPGSGTIISESNLLQASVSPLQASVSPGTPPFTARHATPRTPPGAASNAPTSWRMVQTPRSIKAGVQFDPAGSSPVTVDAHSSPAVVNMQAAHALSNAAFASTRMNGSQDTAAAPIQTLTTTPCRQRVFAPAVGGSSGAAALQSTVLPNSFLQQCVTVSGRGSRFVGPTALGSLSPPPPLEKPS